MNRTLLQDSLTRPRRIPGLWRSLGVLTACLALSPMLAAAGSSLTIDGSTTVGPIAKAFAEYYMGLHADVNITVSESGSGNGAKSLINGVCDVADMSRFMKAKEITAAVEKGVVPVPHVVAIDGIAMVVHPSNPIRELSTEQIRDIYLGEIANWRELGGPDIKIVVVSRDTNSGTYETFGNLVMKKEKMAESVEYLGSNGAIRQKVQSSRTAIGYVGLGFLDRTLKVLTVDGVEPTRLTVATGKYAIARPLYMFTDGYPKLGSHLHAFVTLHLTRKGQELIESIGFIPVTEY